MTPEEYRMRMSLGEAAVQAIYLSFFGILLLFFGTSVMTVIRRGFSSKLIVVTFGLTVINFILFTLVVGAQLAISVELSLSSSVTIVNDSLLEALELVSFWGVNFIKIINVFLIIWRAWAMYQERRLVVVLPFILWLLTVAFFLVDLIYASTSWRIQNYQDGSYEDGIFPLALIFSLSANLLATLLIAFQLWIRRSSVAKTFASSKPWTRVGLVLFLFVECGLEFALLQLIYIVVNFNQYEINNRALVFCIEVVILAFSALFPTVMLLIVQYGCSMVDQFGFITTENTKKIDQADELSDEYRKHHSLEL